ncbi:MAG TPA: hypothetical protein VF543_19250 [Pyrinomonadaceae bacterium]|jgi:hypothetical protein
MNLKRTRILGVYVFVAGFLQLLIYIAMSTSPDKYEWLFYFDPRIGIFFFEIGIRGSEPITPGIFRWLTAGWIFILGLILVLGRPIVKTYIVSELILMIPNVLFFLFIIWANLSPAHGFSIGELFIPALVMIVFSLIPLRLAFWSRSAGGPEIESLNLNRA